MKVTILGAGDAFASGGSSPACYVIEGGGKTILMEAGPSLLPILKRAGFAPADLDLVLISHLHGDHFGGLPFLILEYMWESRLTRTLTIAGPRRLEQRTWTLFENMFSNFPEEKVARLLKFEVLEPAQSRDFGGIKVATHPHPAHPARMSRSLSESGSAARPSCFPATPDGPKSWCRSAPAPTLHLTNAHISTAPRLKFPSQLSADRAESRALQRRAGWCLTHIGREVHEHKSEVKSSWRSTGWKSSL